MAPRPPGWPPDPGKGNFNMHQDSDGILMLLIKSHFALINLYTSLHARSPVATEPFSTSMPLPPPSSRSTSSPSPTSAVPVSRGSTFSLWDALFPKLQATSVARRPLCGPAASASTRSPPDNSLKNVLPRAPSKFAASPRGRRRRHPTTLYAVCGPMPDSPAALVLNELPESHVKNDMTSLAESLDVRLVDPLLGDPAPSSFAKCDNETLTVAPLACTPDIVTCSPAPCAPAELPVEKESLVARLAALHVADPVPTLLEKFNNTNATVASRACTPDLVSLGVAPLSLAAKPVKKEFSADRLGGLFFVDAASLRALAAVSMTSYGLTFNFARHPADDAICDHFVDPPFRPRPGPRLRAHLRHRC